MPASRPRLLLAILWLAAAGGGLVAVLTHRDLVRAMLAEAASVSIVASGLLYLALGSVRGFTLIPSTTLVLVAMAFFPPVPLFVLTLAGILISSASIYWFADALGLAALLERRHASAVGRLTRLSQDHELLIIIGWSFFPFAPTDLICYVCGVLRVNFLKFLIGVAIGEGTICGVYIFLGDQALRWLHLRA